ncbi:MAG: hypothetical protein NZ866_00935 [Patescibacteria group bacterium]|nr:hypothetical protein [Patescibacteria group bacterium]
MLKNKFIYLIAFLSIIALIISIYLTFEHYNKRLPSCLIGTKCDIVLTSKYSEIYGFPMALIGLIYFSLYLLLIFLLKMIKSKIFKNFLILYSLLGSIVGLVLIYLQIFIIKNICSYCFIVDSIAIINFFLTLKI